MKRVLYFTNDLSQANVAMAKEKGVLIRDIRAYGHDDFMESCDAVTGDAPDEYKEKFGYVRLENMDEFLEVPTTTTFEKFKAEQDGEVKDTDEGQGTEEDGQAIPESGAEKDGQSASKITPDDMRAEMDAAGYEFDGRLGDKNIVKVYEAFKEG